ncbi:hypothetical protein ACFQX7_34065 [Luedemannella flava]
MTPVGKAPKTRRRWAGWVAGWMVTVMRVSSAGRLVLRDLRRAGVGVVVRRSDRAVRGIRTIVYSGQRALDTRWKSMWRRERRRGRP